MLVAMMSKAVPEDAQGELQGGISAVMNLAMLFGTVTFAQVFSTFMQQGAAFQTPDAAYFLAAGILALTLALFVTLIKRPVTA
jgi:DHA1 family tetracycline resistance protein-like MFS transporter